MKILLFNGSPEKHGESASIHISNYLQEKLESFGHLVTTFPLKEADLPFLDMNLQEIPASVLEMCATFQHADVHIWLAPLYHGGIPGTMKNCLDWLEITSKSPLPYLAGKVIGLVCWAGGIQAMQGINNMDAIAKALRAWVIPYSLPISRGDLFETGTRNITPAYQARLNILIQSIHALQAGRYPIH